MWEGSRVSLVELELNYDVVKAESNGIYVADVAACGVCGCIDL